MKFTRKRLYEIVFEAETMEGRLFDTILLGLISFSIVIVMLESVQDIYQKYGAVLVVIEWIITITFTFEYILRLAIVAHPIKFVFSFYGIIDFLSTIPTYLSFFFPGSQGLVVIRALRLLRIFRILKMPRHLRESNVILSALNRSKYKIFVFLFSVIMIAIIVGTVMYLIETPEAGFTSIPRSIYWAIVTLTTVGYGDIAPQSSLGQLIASLVMILGYAIIAVPTGIVTSEMSREKFNLKEISTDVCPNCLTEAHDSDAIYCKKCGAILNEQTSNRADKH